MTQIATTPDIAIAGLHASAPQALPFAPSLHIRAFRLERDAGDVLLHSVADPDALRALGPVTRQYLGHRHEAMFVAGGVSAPLFVHAADHGAVAEHAHVRGSFSRRHLLDGDLEVLPIPGHTPGATAFLWDAGAHRVLFSGDTLYLRDGEWVAAVLPSSDRPAYLHSLALLRELDFDVLVPWAASAGDPWWASTDEHDRLDRLDAVIARVRAGLDG